MSATEPWALLVIATTSYAEHKQFDTVGLSQCFTVNLNAPSPSHQLHVRHLILFSFDGLGSKGLAEIFTKSQSRLSSFCFPLSSFVVFSWRKTKETK